MNPGAAANNPAAHGTHVAEVVAAVAAEYVPAGQAVQAVAWILANVPAAQLGQ
jgi:hypothetical protein